MTALILRTPLAVLLRQPHQPRRSRPDGYIGERRGPVRRCRRGCPCIRFARGVAPAAPVLAETQLLPILERVR